MSNRKTFFCAGGCGRSVTVRRFSQADYYICNTRASRDQCLAAIPPLPPGMIRVMVYNAAESFMGITDKIPDADEHAAIARAKRLERYARETSDQAELTLLR